MAEATISTIQIELEGIMVLSFTPLDPPPNPDNGKRQRCLIHVPETDNHHKFVIRAEDMAQPHVINGNSTLTVTGGDVSQTVGFRNYSINMKDEHSGTIQYRAGYQPLHTLSVFDGEFSHHSGRMVNADLKPGGVSRVKTVAESKFVTYRLAAGQELVFTNDTFRKSWSTNQRIKISNLCDHTHPLCDLSDDFSFYYTKVFDVQSHKQLHPIRIPHVFELSSLDREDQLSFLTVRLPCWDVYLDEPPVLP